MKLLIHARNGIGLGHVVRTGRIAGALKELRPDVDIVFATNSRYTRALGGRYKVYVLKGDTREVDAGRYPYEEYLRRNAAAMRRIISRERPAALLFDCEFDGDLLSFCRGRSIKTVFVLRVSKPRRFAALKKGLGLFDRIIVPHDEGDLPGDQRRFLRGLGAVFAGPIVDPAARPRRGGRRNILITLGSGAGIPENRPLFSAADAFLRSLREDGPVIDGRRVSVEVVTGPFYRGACDLSGFKVRSTTPSLARDMCRAKVVISGAGYNTINEIVSTRTPAVVIPLPRREDDQWARAAALERLGCVRIARKGVLAPLRGILREWESYHARFPRIKSGNRRAARVLSSVLASVP